MSGGVGGTGFPLMVRQRDNDGDTIVEWKVMFEVDGSGVHNTDAISVPMNRSCVTGVVEFRRPQDAHPFLVSRSHNPTYLQAGDTLQYAPGRLRVDMDGASLSTLLAPPRTELVSLEDFMQKYPDASPREVWDAAFMAGHQTAHTLLTGEPT